MKASLFYLPSIGSRAEIEAGMAGMRPDLYQRMLEELSEQIRLADDLGYDSIELHRASLPHRGLRALQQPGAARPVRRDADEAHPRRPARHRAAGGQPDPRGRGHRDARPHDRRTRQRRLRPRLPAPLGRRHGAADARHLTAPCRTSTTRSTQANREAFEENFRIIKKRWTRGDADVRRQVLAGPGRRTPWDLETTASTARASRTAC